MLSHYFSENEGKISVSQQQGSDFAKKIANDFNPLHDVGAKKFCVPGDLLFALILNHYGLNASMKFDFMGMVTESTKISFPEDSEIIKIEDNDKELLKVEKKGAHTNNKSLIDALIQSYVSFSGTTFPHILVPLMAEQDVMINPSRPMVMYQSMVLTFDSFDTEQVSLEFTKAKFENQGKRGNIILPFDFYSNGQKIGSGEKHMLVSGIKTYDREAMDALIADYNTWK